MARPQKIYSYENKNGINCQRGCCEIEGCNNLRQLVKPSHGYKNCRYELTTCCKHRKDGGTFHCDSKAKRKETIWKAQGIDMTYGRYKKLLEIQDGKCIICGRPKELEGRALSVDHNHENGKVRGIVCRGCNSALGWIERFMPLDELKDYLEGDVMSRYGDIL